MDRHHRTRKAKKKRYLVSKAENRESHTKATMESSLTKKGMERPMMRKDMAKWRSP